MRRRLEGAAYPRTPNLAPRRISIIERPMSLAYYEQHYEQLRKKFDREREKFGGK
jgi:hypothetical protein